jgi:hypothetical protein
VSKINLVDLAGSERQSNKQLSASEQARFKEGIAINKSLSALSNCIFALFKQSQEGKGGKQVRFCDWCTTPKAKTKTLGTWRRGLFKRHPNGTNQGM